MYIFYFIILIIILGYSYLNYSILIIMRLNRIIINEYVGICVVFYFLVVLVVFIIFSSGYIIAEIHSSY